MTSTLKTTIIQEPSSSTANITLDSSGNATIGASLTAATNLTATSGNITASAGTMVMSSSFLRNRIINGNMAVDQRNAGAAQTLTSGGLYSVDRWQTYAYTANLTGQQVAGSSGFQYAYRITGASGNTQAQLQQKIEAANCYDLAGQTVTLSAYMANTSNTTMNWVVYYANSTDNFSANTIVTSGTWTLTSSLARYTATFSLPSAANTGLLIIFYNSGQTSGTWTTTGVQLEQGSVATPFERPLISKQLADCQRYYAKTYTQSTAPGTASVTTSIGTYGTSNTMVTWYFPVVMRTRPTITLYSPQSGTAGNCYASSSGDRAASVSAYSDISASLYNTATAGTEYYYYMAVANAEL